jgi:CDP-paratose 2-epimerase
MALQVLVTGICGFVGSSLAEALIERLDGVALRGIDNLSRPGSEINRGRLSRLGVDVIHGDLRNWSDVAQLPQADWVIDAAANPSVLAGVDGRTSSRQLVEHNLLGTVNLLEYCKAVRAGLILLSSSRVFSIPLLAGLPVLEHGSAFHLDESRPLPPGISAHGVNEEFPVSAPVSLYGSTKLASEILALEYAAAFGFPIWINRCGVLSGAGQFGVPDQGIFAYWINAHLRRRALGYIGFGGKGYQVRDAFHPQDLAALVSAQMHTGRMNGRRVYTAGGGPGNAMSLALLTAWCDDRFGRHTPEADPRVRPFDIPWMVMDSRSAANDFGWRPEIPLVSILEAIARHAENHPQWLEICLPK